MKLWTVYERRDGAYELRSCEVVEEEHDYRYDDTWSNSAGFSFGGHMSKNDPRYATTPQDACANKLRILEHGITTLRTEIEVAGKQHDAVHELLDAVWGIV